MSREFLFYSSSHFSKKVKFRFVVCKFRTFLQESQVPLEAKRLMFYFFWQGSRHLISKKGAVYSIPFYLPPKIFEKRYGIKISCWAIISVICVKRQKRKSVSPSSASLPSAPVICFARLGRQLPKYVMSVWVLGVSRQVVAVRREPFAKSIIEFANWLMMANIKY